MRKGILASAYLCVLFLLERESSAQEDGGMLPQAKYAQGSDSETSLEFLEAANDRAPRGPSILDPGPDTADLPDSAFTVPVGVAYFETSLTYESSKGPRTRDYFTATLIRVGIIEDFEFRVSTPGVTHRHAPDESTTGFGPMTFGFKTHIWDEVPSTFIPAFGIIAQVSTPTSSAGFDNGTAEPTVFFNFDYSLPREWAFEINGGMAWLNGDDGERFLQGQVLWSLGRDWTDQFKTFFHGFTTFPGGSGEGEEVVLGPGAFWALSDRLALDASYNFGLTEESPHRLIRGGLSMAF